VVEAPQDVLNRDATINIIVKFLINHQGEHTFKINPSSEYFDHTPYYYLEKQPVKSAPEGIEPRTYLYDNGVAAL